MGAGLDRTEMKRAAHPCRRAMPWLLGLALLLRALVPTGWMPAAAAGGGVALVPCTGLTPAPAPTTMHGGHHVVGVDQHHNHSAPQPDHDGKGTQLCAFSGLAFAWTGADQPWIALPTAFEAPTPAVLQSRSAPRPSASPPPPSTGPPSA
jgi:hypothetical protein